LDVGKGHKKQFWKRTIQIWLSGSGEENQNVKS